MITGIAHACFRVNDLERALHFYCEQLGLTPAFEFVRDGKKFGQYIHVGGRAFIELFLGEVTPPVKTQSYGHICLEVDDIEATVRTLRERGVEASEIKLGSDNAYQSWITDPDGNRIELHCYTPTSKQGGWLK
jgi:catechol 2,3-dioxygenase-like lactoylglutathione lyase family enzyme